MNAAPRIVVFGGTGFLGHRIVSHLADSGCRVRAASRQVTKPASGMGASVEQFTADINDAGQVEAAMENAAAVINAVSHYRETGGDTFQSIHVEGAARIARLATCLGITNCILISGIGADANSDSPYIRARGQGENAVRAASPTARIVRPAVMFGLDDNFLTRLCDLVSAFPVLPMFGNGNTSLQPAWVDDVAKACAMLADQNASDTVSICELGGPSVYRYKELIEKIASLRGRKVRQVPVHFALWKLAARLGRTIGADLIPDMTQIELLEHDNVASSNVPGFKHFEIVPRSIESLEPLI